MAITNATIAQQISDLIGYWDGFAEEYQDWLGGSAAGGPNSDGQYPLTDYQGTTSLVDCPAKLSDTVSNNVTGALAHKTAAEAAQTASETAKTGSELAETNAAASEASSLIYKDAALAAQVAAESARATAIAQAAVATANAALTAADVVTTNANVALTAADVIAAAASAAAAAASEAAAATFNPALYAALADNETVAGQYTFSHASGILIGAAPLTAALIANWNTAFGWGNHAGLYASAASVANAANWDTAYGWGDHAGAYLPIGGGTLTGDLTISGTAVSHWFKETDAAVDNKNWRFVVSGENFYLQAWNDAFTVSASAMTVLRTGATIDSVVFGAPITATSYGGVLEANILDKTAAETITANLTIDTDGVGPMLTLGDGAGADGDTLLYFNTDRGWKFKQQNIGAGTYLALQQDNDGKQFKIESALGTSQFVFRPYDTGNPTFWIYDLAGTDYASFYHDGTDFNTTFQNTTDWNISGFSTLRVTGGIVGTANITTAGGYVAGGDGLTSTYIDQYGCYASRVSAYLTNTHATGVWNIRSNGGFNFARTSDGLQVASIGMPSGDFTTIGKVEGATMYSSGRARMAYGIDGGYSEAGGGTTFGATVWSIGDTWKGGAAGANSAATSVYGIRYLRSTHAQAHSSVGEGLYLYTNAVNRGGIGASGIQTDGVIEVGGNITRTSKGVYTYYDDSTYVGGKITVSSTTPTGPTKGDIWFDTT